MGLEISGIIEKLGEDVPAKSQWKTGDRVCALLGGGGYAQYAAVRYDMLMPIPEQVSMEEAAAMPEAFATAYLNLFLEGGLKSGDVFLMHAGASGLASVVIPMAKAFGAKVITTIIDEDKRAIVAKTGADMIVNTRKEDIVQVLKKLEAKGTPVNLAIDCLGGEIMGKCLPHLAYMAKWIMIATLAGDLTELDMRKLYVKNVRVIGSTLRSKPAEMKAEILNNLVKHIWAKVSSGEIRPIIDRILPITQADAAHALLSGNKSAGKVVLKVE
jgi:NAD(P)H quinone oxidoreductase, PIG3 family